MLTSKKSEMNREITHTSHLQLKLVKSAGMPSKLLSVERRLPKTLDDGLGTPQGYLLQLQLVARSFWES